MRGLDAALRAVTEPTRPARVDHEAFGVAERVRAVDRRDAGGDAFDEKALARVRELDRVTAALGAKIGGEILGGEQACGHALARARDRVRLDESARELDVGHQSRRSRGEAETPLQARHLPIQFADLIGLRHLGKGDDVRRGAHHLGEVLCAVACQWVDADGHEAPVPAPVRKGVRGERARLGAERGRREILELLDQRVGTAVRSALERVPVGAGDEQP